MELSQGQYIVLDTNTTIVDLMHDFGQVIPYLKRSHSGLTCLEQVIESLDYEQDALVNLGSFAMDLASDLDAIATSHMNLNTQEMVQRVYDYGRQIYAKLMMLRLYESGRLQYEYHSWCNNYLLLRKKPQGIVYVFTYRTESA